MPEMKRVALAFLLSAASGCDLTTPSDRSDYVEFFGESITTERRMEIRNTLATNGYVNIRIGYYYGSVMITAYHPDCAGNRTHPTERNDRP